MKTMMDASGHDVPVKYVAPYDRARDKAVRRILARWQQARKCLEKTLQESLDDMQRLMDCKEKLGEKGNFSARSFDGKIQVSIDQHYCVLLDERVVKARELMLEYVKDLMHSVPEEQSAGLMAIVSEAFKENGNSSPFSRFFSKLEKYPLKNPFPHPRFLKISPPLKFPSFPMFSLLFPFFPISHPHLPYSVVSFYRRSS